MPQPKSQQQQQQQQGNESRIITGPDPERFYCPHPGCNRSFAELWRLKVHYRAPPDVRGSGKERGHGTELKWCPKCGKDLKPGKHHVGCSAGKSAPRQAAKRQRQMSTTTESEWVSSEHSDSLEAAVRRQATRRQITQSEASTGPVRQQQQQHKIQRGDSCRLERIKQGIDGGELLFTSGGTATGTTDFGLLMSGIGIKQEQGAADLTLAPNLPAAASGDSSAVHQQHYVPPPAQPQGGTEQAMPASAFTLHGGGDLMEWLRAPSPLLEEPVDMGAAQQLHAALDSHQPNQHYHHHVGVGSNGFDDDADALLRVPSPPPLPPDWDPHARTGLLFDFDQFDASKRAAQQAQRLPSVSAPMMTLTSSMSPQELTNPSDEYIWQILFAGENDPVPKRVTAHLHHHPPDFFDDDPLLDSLLGHDLAPVHGHYNAMPGANGQARLQQQMAGGNGHSGPPVLDAIDAVLAQLHPAPLDSLLGNGQHAQQQEPHSGGTSTDLSLSPEGEGQPGSAAQHQPEPVQQVPQVQSPNSYALHAAPRPVLPIGKLKQDTTSPTGQCAPSPPRLPQQPLEIEVSGGADFLGGFL